MGSTCKHWLTLWNTLIYDCMEGGSSLNDIFLDLSNAFDSRLSYYLILHKINNLGVREDLHFVGLEATSEGDIACRSQTDSWARKNHQVDPASSSCLRGVCQGSVIRPVLFILFLNDFP